LRLLEILDNLPVKIIISPKRAQKTNEKADQRKLAWRSVKKGQVAGCARYLPPHNTEKRRSGAY
jgi:hypothetical protein